MSWQGRLSTLLVYHYSKDITATLACVGRHSTSAAAVAVLLLQPPRCAVSCCAVHCLVLLMAACRQCCLVVPAGSALSTWPRCSHCWTVPFRHSPVLLWVRHGLTVPSLVVLPSRLFCMSGLSYSSCPGCRRGFALADCPGAVAPGWLLSRIIVDASAGRLWGCPLFACTVHHLFCDRLGVPTGSRCPGFVCVSRWFILLCIRGCQPPALCRTHLFPVSDVSI